MSEATTILVVEDDRAIREMMAGMLRGEGYRVLQAADGPDALELVFGHSGRLDLVICDVNLPGLGGGKVVAELVETHPDLNFLYVSGHGHPPEDLTLRDAAGRSIAFLPKPFEAADLIQATLAALFRPR